MPLWRPQCGYCGGHRRPHLSPKQSFCAAIEALLYDPKISLLRDWLLQKLCRLALIWNQILDECTFAGHRIDGPEIRINRVTFTHYRIYVECFYSMFDLRTDMITWWKLKFWNLTKTVITPDRGEYHPHNELFIFQIGPAQLSIV